MTHPRRPIPDRRARKALLVALLVIGCGLPAPGPSATPDARTQAAPGATPLFPSATSTASTAEIVALVASMEAAVLAADRAAYLALVDIDDGVFELEHTRWADDWSGPNPVTRYSLDVAAIEVGDEGATGQLTVTWGTPGTTESRTTTFAVRFTHGAAGWRYAGEEWMATEAPHFRVLVAPGLEGAVPGIVADLPGVYDHVTASLDHTPDRSMQIKLYADAPALVANTLLSLPDIRGWNEPGEALKLRFDPVEPSLAPVIAHEFSHFVLFDRAGTHRTRMPWWLDEGVAGFVAAFYEGGQTDDRLAQVVAWGAAGELAEWSEMAVFEETPVERWTFVYPQGYAMVRYVTERYGDVERNAWLAAMATDMEIAEATPATLGVSFDALDAGFRDWLGDR